MMAVYSAPSITISGIILSLQHLKITPPPSLLPQSKEEVMAVRLREADSMASMAELRQKVAELEIQVNIPLCVFKVYANTEDV